MEEITTEPAAYHPIKHMENVPECLKTVFEGGWIETVEQAVGFLCASDIKVEGKEEFLVNAKNILGEEAFLKYSTPVEHPPLGCDEPQPAVKVVTENRPIAAEARKSDIDGQSGVASDESASSVGDGAKNA